MPQNEVETGVEGVKKCAIDARLTSCDDNDVYLHGWLQALEQGMQPTCCLTERSHHSCTAVKTILACADALDLVVAGAAA